MRNSQLRSASNGHGCLPGISLTKDHDDSSIETRIANHEGLLTQIVSGFGFHETVSDQLLDELRVQVKMQFGEIQGSLPFKVWIAKILLRKCIFRTGADLFNGLSNIHEKHAYPGSLANDKSIYGPGQAKIPLSFWVVYFLHQHIGFTEREIAEILNTSLISTRERLNKALQYISGT